MNGSAGGTGRNNATPTPHNSPTLDANNGESQQLGRKISSSGRFTVSILEPASSPALSVASSSSAINMERAENGGHLQSERIVRFAVGGGNCEPSGAFQNSAMWASDFERGVSDMDATNDHTVNSTVCAGSSSNNNTATAYNLKSWRHMETLDHPPIMDFYRNADSLDADYGPLGGTVPSRPSMLELLHGAANDEELTSSLDFHREDEAASVALLERNAVDRGTRSRQHSHDTDIHVAHDDVDAKPTAVRCASELRLNGTMGKARSPPASSAPSVSGASRSAPKFGWLEGVFFRCLLNIFGVMLYLRVSWVAGQAGIVLGCAVVLLASLVTTITALSTCAICTNGDVKGGGAYFLISRSLGPEFGGSIGLIFSVANAVGAAMYVVGFAETVRNVLKERGIELFDGALWDVRAVGAVTCILLMVVVFIGTGFESKMQMGLLAILALSIADYFVGTVLPPNTEQASRGLTGYSLATAGENLWPAFRGGYTFFTVFAIYFPAATGIMAGANISGDLRDAQRAIPLGTLLAIFVTTSVYLVTVVATGSTCVRDADGVGAAGSTPACVSNGTCPYGLMNHFQVMELSAVWGPLVTAGIFAATLSSALASLVSAPKIFQAVCRDQLFPYIGSFATAYGRYGEPRRAYALAFVIAMAMVAIGDLNAIAPIISNFFLCSYALINYACFDASFARSPGFRPSFKYYNMWVSLGGALLCVSVMFIVSWPTALLTFFLFALLFLYIRQRKPDVNWGSSTQANAYRNALHAVMKLEHTNEHVKTYRPHVLVLSGNPSSRPSLVDFAFNITKGNSLMVCGYVVPLPPPPSSTASDSAAGGIALRRLHQEQLRLWLRRRGVKALISCAVNSNRRLGSQTLIQAAGLGRLRPNILLIGYKHNWRECPLSEVDDYFGTIQDAFDANLGVAVLKADAAGQDFTDALRLHDLLDVRSKGLPLNGSQLPPHSTHDPQHKTAATVAVMAAKKCSVRRLTSAQRELLSSVNRFQRRLKRGRIDVWWLYDDGGLTLLIPHLLSQPKSYLEGAHLRIFTIATSSSGLEHEQRSMASLLSKFRIEFSDLQVVQDISRAPRRETLDYFNALISAPSPQQTSTTTNIDPYPLVTPHELESQRQRTLRQLRIAELLRERSADADLIVLSLPVPRKGVVSSRLYMAWLEAMTHDLSPTLLVRGNQSSVLTFYS